MFELKNTSFQLKQLILIKKDSRVKNTKNRRKQKYYYYYYYYYLAV